MMRLPALLRSFASAKRDIWKLSSIEALSISHKRSVHYSHPPHDRKADDASNKAQQQTETAKAVSSWLMFPWEKRQMDGERVPLHTWEKVYWWIFVGGLTFLLFSWIRGPSSTEKPKDEKAERELEAKKREVARAVLAGKSVTAADVDVFEGFTPRQIERFVKETTGASAEDPYEGLSPEEIDAYVEKHGH